MMLTPRGVAGIGAYVGTGASRSIAARRGESGTGVVAVMASCKARTLGSNRGDTWNISSIISGGWTVGATR